MADPLSRALGQTVVVKDKPGANGNTGTDAMAKASRVPLLANEPAIAEQGADGFESDTWQGVVVPASLLAPVVARQSNELIRNSLARGARAPRGAGRRGVLDDAPHLTAFFDTERRHGASVVANGGVRID